MDCINNEIINNQIYSNGIYGIYVKHDTADYNNIISNELWGWNQDCGIYVEDGDDTLIARNRIHHNATNGISVNGSAERANILHNTIYSNVYDGLLVANSASVYVTNNIRLTITFPALME